MEREKKKKKEKKKALNKYDCLLNACQHFGHERLHRILRKINLL